MGLCSLSIVWAQVRLSWGNGNSSKRTYAEPPRITAPNAPDPTAVHCGPAHLAETPKHRRVWLSLLWGHCSFLMDPCALGFVCALQVPLFPQSCGISMIPLTVNVRFLGDAQSLCWIPRWESLLWCLELSQQCKNFLV